MDYMPKISAVLQLQDCTAVPDELKTNYGPVTAIVWGELFRFCQMYDSVCNASIETIAKCCGLSPRTVINHLQILCDNGYAVDETPGLRNKPHTYHITSKIKIKMTISEPNYLGISGTLIKPELEDDKQTPKELWEG